MVGISTRIGDYQARVDYALAALDEQGFGARFWDKDPSLWRQGPDGEKVILNRLGWLDVQNTIFTQRDRIMQLAEGVRNAGMTHAVLMGMGGSSLSPEVSRLTFGVREGYLNLLVLDSTDPAAVLDVEKLIDPAKTLFIVSTKSGNTIETLSAYRYFYDKVKAAKGGDTGQNFIAITDPGSPLETMAADAGFRAVFLNPPDIGGRYSALSFFGIIPAVLIGVDIDQLLQRASEMVESCGPSVAPSENPGIVLGVAMAELAMEGRNKLTLVTSEPIRSFGYWVEQLVAESTGKNGAGSLPVEGEALVSPDKYGDDRLFVYTELMSSKDEDMDTRVSALEKSGHPVIRIRVEDKYDLGSLYFLWELATGTASAVLGVNAFDEPNVKESKDNTSRLIEEFKAGGKLPELSPVVDQNGIKLYCDEETKAVLDRIRAREPYRDESLLSYISAYLDEFQPGNYFALMAFLNMTPEVDSVFQCMRSHLLEAYSAATTLGYGPRFLHSTGQYHKGGPNTGIFIQFTVDDAVDMQIPGEPYTFSVLKQAQAMGDAISLRSKGRPLIRLHVGLDVVSGLNKILDVIHQAVEEQPED